LFESEKHIEMVATYFLENSIISSQPYPHDTTNARARSNVPPSFWDVGAWE